MISLVLTFRSISFASYEILLYIIVVLEFKRFEGKKDMALFWYEWIIIISLKWEQIFCFAVLTKKTFYPEQLFSGC